MSNVIETLYEDGYKDGWNEALYRFRDLLGMEGEWVFGDVEAWRVVQAIKAMSEEIGEYHGLSEVAKEKADEIGTKPTFLNVHPDQVTEDAKMAMFRDAAYGDGFKAGVKSVVEKDYESGYQDGYDAGINRRAPDCKKK